MMQSDLGVDLVAGGFLEIEHPLTHMTVAALMHPPHTVEPFYCTTGALLAV